MNKDYTCRRTTSISHREVEPLEIILIIMLGRMPQISRILPHEASIGGANAATVWLDRGGLGP